MSDIQASTSTQVQQPLTYTSSGTQGKAPASTGTAGYDGVVVERTGQTNSAGQSTSTALSKNATLSTASGFALGATDGSVTAGINEALSKLIEVDILRKKLNRDLVFMEADTIASKMKTAAEKERKGAALAMGMAIGGAFTSFALGAGTVVASNRSATALKAQNKQLKELEGMHTQITNPMKNSLDGPDGAIDYGKFAGPDAPKAYQTRTPDKQTKIDENGVSREVPKEVNAQEATREMMAELDELAEGRAMLKDANGKWVRGTNDKGEAVYLSKKFSDMSEEELARSVGPNLAKLGAESPEKLQTHMAALKKKVDSEVRLRSLVTNTNPDPNGTPAFGAKDIVSGKNVQHPLEVGAAQKQLMAHESKMAETGYTDQSITDQLREISRADANLNAMANLAATPGTMISNIGGSVADLTFNKEAKELEAEATRDGATQSFLSDNAGTVGSEIQGAMQGIDAVKGYIEVGSAIAAGMRA